ncbi:hypothetical protein ABK040_016191 [Willaertia magna]
MASKTGIYVSCVSLLLALVLNTIFLAVGIYFAKHYYDSMYDLFHSTSKPLVTQEIKECLVENNAMDCEIMLNDKTTLPGSTYNFRYCHAKVQYTYQNTRYSNVTLDHFPQAYQEGNGQWVEIYQNTLNSTLYSKIRLTNYIYPCFISETFPDRFVAFEKRDIIYYYLNDVNSLIDGFSVAAIALLVPSVFLCLTWVPISFCCIIFQFNKYRKNKRSSGSSFARDDGL